MITEDTVKAASNTGQLLVLAMDAGEKETFQHLLYLGADPNQFTSTGRAPIHLAVYEEDSSWLSMCLAHGGNPNLVRPNVSDFNFETPVECAVCSGQVKNLGLLLDAGGNIELEDPVDGTPLCNSVASSQYEATLLLLERGAKYSRADQPRFISSIEAQIQIDRNWQKRDPNDRNPNATNPFFIKVVAWLEDKGVVLEKDWK